MCGRYSLALQSQQQPREARRRLQDESHMPAQEAPEDNATRETYNFAPGYFGLVYRADTSDKGAAKQDSEHHSEQDAIPRHTDNEEHDAASKAEQPLYKLQAMKWGLVPFWTKRNPDYGSMMRTINCRDDSLATPGGMWNTMKQNKRCVVIAQGFYEWLKKDGGRTKIPHFVKRKDGQLMCFAGLWDCVKYEDAQDKLFTYTIVTTDSNKDLKFLHDRMPVILDNGSDDMFKWLDAGRSEWSKELQSLLKPYDGELECYPVKQDVGKVGNDSASFIVPLDSAENKQNIANFFGNQKTQGSNDTLDKHTAAKGSQQADQPSGQPMHADDEPRSTIDANDDEDNAPVPVPVSTGGKRKLDHTSAAGGKDGKARRTSGSPSQSSSPAKSLSSRRLGPAEAAKKKRSATSNGSLPKASPVKDGSQKITNFFGK